MKIREIALVGLVILIPGANVAQDKPKASAGSSVESGKQTYVNYCASCHGADARGHGPAAASQRKSPADLRALALRHDGKFPEDYVTRVVRSGDPMTAHGSAEMPVWGPVFSMQENGDEAGVSRRIKSLCDYLASIQDKKS